jgi:hypothetical protein
LEESVLFAPRSSDISLAFEVTGVRRAWLILQMADMGALVSQ